MNILPHLYLLLFLHAQLLINTAGFDYFKLSPISSDQCCLRYYTLVASGLLWKIHRWKLRGLYLKFCGYTLIDSAPTYVFTTKQFLLFTVF